MSKKKVNKVVKNSEVSSSESIKETSPKVKVEKVKVEKVVKAEPTIFDKFRNHINTANDGYIKDLSYPEAMEVLRYIQKATGHKMGLNMSCSSCLIDLLKMFGRLENKK